MISCAILAISMSYVDPSRVTVSPEELKSTIEKLSSWKTRNTNTPELFEAADWIAERYRELPGCQVELMRYTVTAGPRVPVTKEVVQVIATFAANQSPQVGAVMMGAHFDTINMQPNADVYSSRAPGANDDGSGVAASLAVAKRLASTAHGHPYVFVAFSGEEQGLLGSTALAERANKTEFPITAVLSNDMIGNSGNVAGQVDPHHVRVFSEESTKHNSRELARYIEWLLRTSGAKDLNVKLVFRPDRFGRGGDHTPFNNAGFTAVRLVEMHEEYSRQHTDQDLPKSVDYEYLTRVANLNLVVMSQIGNAGAAPTHVRVDRHQNHDTAITWIASPGVKYVAYWRDTTEPTWTHSKHLGAVDKFGLEMIGKDENVFAIGAEGGIPVVAN